MPRPKSRRRVFSMPRYSEFHPLGTPDETLEEINLTIDELEAVRLSDLEGMYQQQAARQMNVSRQTFGRILESARHKVARALIDGNRLRINGGNYNVPTVSMLRCVSCDHEWQVRALSKDLGLCPRCESDMVEPV